MKKSIILTLFAIILFATLIVFARTPKNVQDQQACDYARKKGTAEVWQDYLRQFPQGMCFFEAESEIKDLNKRPQNRELQWSSRSSSTENWGFAKKYCEDLDEGGYSDWRLPTISELKTIIKNCQSGGSACRVSDNCLSSDSCWSENCRCSFGGSYGKLGDSDGVSLWSSSPRSDKTNYAWYVQFSNGGVFSGWGYEGYSVRCVR